MAATDTRLGAVVAGLAAGTLAAGSAHAVDLPEDRAEAMVHLYDGGGTKAYGPAVLVRKSVADRVSLSGSYYIDAVSNASIDVVTTASKYKETRHEYAVGADYVERDTLIHVGASRSKEPDYIADTLSADLTQDVFGGMTTIAFGFSHGSDKVGQTGTPGWIDTARHWQYRAGVTQILTTRWVASLNLESVNDAGFLGSPYRVARVFGATVPERDPRTRESRALKVGAVGDITPAGATQRSSVHVSYRYFWDTWDVKAHTLEVGYSRYFAPGWTGDAFVRLYKQEHALFYSDNAQTETLYVSRNRELSSFSDYGLGAKVTYKLRDVPGKYQVNLTGAYQLLSFHYKDYTDVRSGDKYSFNAHVLQGYVSATF